MSSIGLRLNAVHYVWLALLLAGGFLLGKGNFWGGFLGAAPGLHIVLMSMQETGQVINELPGGLAVIAFYLLCGIYVLRKEEGEARENELEK